MKQPRHKALAILAFIIIFGCVGFFMVKGGKPFPTKNVPSADDAPTLLESTDGGKENAKTRMPGISGEPQEETNAADVVELEPLPRDQPNPYRIKHAVTFGARGKITLHVVDSNGQDVPGAAIQGGFYNNGKSGYEIKEKTGVSGRVTLENDCTGDLNFWIEKEGYYRTSNRYWFFKNGFDCVKRGRWLPWNPTLRIVLKEKRAPVSLAITQIDSFLQVREPTGFDCVKGDWTQPHGKGDTADIAFHYDSVCDDTYRFLTNRLVITVNHGGGFQILRGDAFSRFKSVYEAPDDGYTDTVECQFERSGSTIAKNITVTENDYIVFRIRRESGASDSSPIFRYGKIYNFRYGESLNKKGNGYIKFTHYFNPNPGDRNLEAEGRYP